MKGERSLRMDLESYYIPKENKNKSKGEDAHFMNKDYQTIGVADGVGVWARKGIDAGEYARELVENCVLSLYNQNKESVNPRVVLEEAYLNTKAQGSSTACIITLAQNNYLHAVNVGDSGFMLFRNGGMTYKSPIQQCAFNCPYQLGRSRGCHPPSSAKEFKVQVREGDILVVATDGLFDNMFVNEIMEIINNEKKEWARKIAEVASYNSMDKDRDSPFAEASRFAGVGQGIKGGKVDDITVLVAHIVFW